MTLGIALTYSEIFDGPLPKLDDLLKDISSDLTITILSVINAQLYLDESLDGQIKLIDTLLYRSPELQQVVKNKMSLRRSGGAEAVSLFSIRFTLEFLHYEFTHYRDNDLPDTRQEDEENFFKAYLVISQMVNDSYSAEMRKEDTSDPFYGKLWPVMLGQFQIEDPLNPVTEIPKSVAFLNYFESSISYSSYVSTFLTKHNKASSWNYVLDLVNLIQVAWEAKKNNPQRLFPFSINATQEYESQLFYLTNNVERYQAKYANNKSGFTGLKEFPLFKTKKGLLLVLNFNFLASKVYDSLVFDFYYLSGINAVEKFKEFLNYKTFISSEITEKFLFRKLIQQCFSNKHDVVLFDEDGRPGFPDAYVRRGKYIFLFEMKDALFPSKVIDHPTYADIKNEIDTKYNTERKGTGQLIQQLLYLKVNFYEPNSFQDLKLKRKNLVIYPIIIYTDRHYSLPGINRYLITEFQHKLQRQNLNEVFNKIKPITFISLAFLMDHIDILEQNDTSLPAVINQYLDFLKESNKKLTKKVTVHNSLVINETLETTFLRKHAKKLDRKNRNYVESIVSLFGLTENLKSDNLPNQ